MAKSKSSLSTFCHSNCSFFWVTDRLTSGDSTCRQSLKMSRELTDALVWFSNVVAGENIENSHAVQGRRFWGLNYTGNFVYFMLPDETPSLWTLREVWQTSESTFSKGRNVSQFPIYCIDVIELSTHTEERSSQVRKNSLWLRVQVALLHASRCDRRRHWTWTFPATRDRSSQKKPEKRTANNLFNFIEWEVFFLKS